jgi:ribosomal protein L11 methyltransferase
MTSHFQISVTISPDKIEKLSDIFSDLGAEAITMTDAKDEPLFQLEPEDEPHWQQTTLHALFDTQFSPDQVIQTILQDNPEFKTLDFYVEKIANQNWVEVTQKQFHAQQFGHLWICPQWEKATWEKSHRSKKEPVVFIEPGLAFGTGTHPTTQLCLTWLATHSLRKKTVIDYGCGSGILALAAMALDAKTVWATDHDHQALISTENNASYNAFKNTLHIVNTTDIRSARADIVIANILANPLIELAPILSELVAENGTLVLSGVLEVDAERVAAAYKNRFEKINIQAQDGWVLIELA